MSTVVPTVLAQDQRVVLHDVDWDTYEALLASRESRQGRVRLTYDRGRLIIVSPSQEHETSAERLGLLVRLAAAGLGVPCLGVGGTTLRREDLQRGKEADTAFYLANEPKVRGRAIDLDVDPPPDLAIEVEATHSDRGMFDLYAALGVPELWQYDFETLRAYVLREGSGYEPAQASAYLPLLPLDELPRWLEHAETEGESAMTLGFLDWVRGTLAPRAGR
jgi:Uma2 family endonuclease